MYEADGKGVLAFGMSRSTVDALRHGLYLKNLPHVLGDLAHPSKAVEYAIAAEDAGWDAVFMAD